MASARQVSLVPCSGTVSLCSGRRPPEPAVEQVTVSLCSGLRPPEPAVEQAKGRVGELFLGIVPDCVHHFLFAELEILQVNS